MQRWGDSFGGDGRSSRTQPVDNAAKGRLACVGTNGWVRHSFRSETGGDEDLGVAELGLQRGVSFRGLHDVAGCLGVKAGGEVARRRLETEFGKQLPVFRSVQASWWIRLNCAEGVVAISPKAVRSTGTERSKPAGVSTQGSGLSPILMFRGIRVVLIDQQARSTPGERAADAAHAEVLVEDGEDDRRWKQHHH
jgi:hypothetical protein